MSYLLHLWRNAQVVFAEKPTHKDVTITRMGQRVSETGSWMLAKFCGELSAFFGAEAVEA